MSLPLAVSVDSGELILRKGAYAYDRVGSAFDPQSTCLTD
jgi:hypothetical protein